MIDGCISAKLENALFCDGDTVEGKMPWPVDPLLLCGCGCGVTDRPCETSELADEVCPASDVNLGPSVLVPEMNAHCVVDDPKVAIRGEEDDPPAVDMPMGTLSRLVGTIIDEVTRDGFTGTAPLTVDNWPRGERLLAEENTLSDSGAVEERSNVSEGEGWGMLRANEDDKNPESMVLDEPTGMGDVIIEGSVVPEIASEKSVVGHGKIGGVSKPVVDPN